MDSISNYLCGRLGSLFRRWDMDPGACVWSVLTNLLWIMNNEQDIRKLNGFFNLNPGLSVMFFIANLSLIGFPFFSGFYSKETIITHWLLCA